MVAPTRPETKIVYGNDPGISILESIEALRDEIRGLRESARSTSDGWKSTQEP